VSNGDKLTHFTVSKISNKISVWGDLAPQLFGCINPMKSAPMLCVSYEMHSLATGTRKAGLKDSNYARQRSVAVETTTAQVLTMLMMTTLC